VEKGYVKGYVSHNTQYSLLIVTHIQMLHIIRDYDKRVKKLNQWFVSHQL
jgi:hypothetical protein